MRPGVARVPVQVLIAVAVLSLGAVGLAVGLHLTQLGADGRRTDGPMRVPNAHGYTTSMRTGTEFTDSFEVLHLGGDRPATIDAVRLEDADGFELLGAQLSSPARPFAAVQFTRQWPPVHRYLPPDTLTDAAGATISTSPEGWELLVGMRVTGEGYLIRDAVIVDYTVGDRKYSVRLPAQVVICTDPGVEQHGSCPEPDPVPSATTTGATATQARSFSHYSAELERLAHRYRGFGYYEADATRTIELGFVGRTPAEVRERIAEAPDGVQVRLGHSLYTHRQLTRAMNKAIVGPTYTVYEAETLAHGRGIRVVTDSDRLLSAFNPRRLLGVRVGVLVLRGSAGTAQAA